MKSEHFGQIFVSRTRPGITRGNHYHHTKTEKFLVVEGEALIRLRDVRTLNADQSKPNNQPLPINPAVIEHRVSGKDFRVVDIPPGFTHSIDNVGNTEMVVLFWASEVFNPERPDTVAANVMV
jgi:UDP-2-acetamido-2,6-beta-L-arabino-hexul-4-ose reductase